MNSRIAVADAGSECAPPAAPRIRRRRKQARPAELLDAALGVFIEKGFAATCADEIAARAGVAKGTLYLYFRNKEELFKAVITRQLPTMMDASAQRLVTHTGSGADLIRCLLDAWWSLLADDAVGGVFKLLIVEARNFPELADLWARDVVEPGRRLIAQVLSDGMERGEFRRLAVDVVIRSLLLPMFMAGLYRHSIGACRAVDPLLDDPGFFTRHVDFVLQGLAPCGCSTAPD